MSSLYESFNMEIWKLKNTRTCQAVHCLKINWIPPLKHEKQVQKSRFEWRAQLGSNKGFECESLQNELEKRILFSETDLSLATNLTAETINKYKEFSICWQHFTLIFVFSCSYLLKSVLDSCDYLFALHGQYL